LLNDTAALWGGGIADFEFEFTFFGTQDDRLAFHAADHVEGRARSTAQSHLQNIFLDARLDGFAQLILDLKEAVGRTEPFDPLMRALVVVISDPKFDPFTRLLKTVELRARQKLLPDTLPEALDLTQGHGMMRPALDMNDAILAQLRFETRGAAPAGVLRPIIGEHLLRRLILAHGHTIDFDGGLSGGTAKEIRAGDVTRIIIQESDEISVTAAKPESENITLPKLIRRRPLKETWPSEIALLWQRR
jgi:hypothetical protein